MCGFECIVVQEENAMSTKKHMSLPAQMGAGMLLGILAGAAIQFYAIPTSYFQPFGQLFINLVRMVVVPLVIVSLISGAASVGDVGRLGRMAGKTLIYYFLTTAVAIIIGLLLGNLFQPGAGLNLAQDVASVKVSTPPSMVKVLMDIVPVNPVESLSKGNMLQIIFFAVMLGFSLSLCGEKGQPAIAFFDSMTEAMLHLTRLVMYYAPIGVFALMAVAVGRHGLGVLLPLIKLVGIMYLGCIIHVLLVYIPIVRWAGLRPAHFFRVLSAPLLIAFSSCSSAAALSSNMEGVQRLGASRSVSSFSIPLGNTINMDGTAIYMGVVAIFAAELYGVPMPFDKQLSVLLMGILASVGSMGVPGAGLLMVTMVFTQVGIPLEAVGIVAGIDRVLDMARTTINVLGDATGAICVSKLENDLDPERGARMESTL